MDYAQTHNQIRKADKSTKTGLAHWCRECCRAKCSRQYAENKPERLKSQRDWFKANPEKTLLNNQRQYANNREIRIATAMAYQKAHPEKVKEWTRNTYLNNPDYYANKSIWRHNNLKTATPTWVNRAEIEAIYAEARRLSKETSVQYEVDHYHALQGETDQGNKFCGLHVPWNLQIITRFENRSKGNRLPRDDKDELLRVA